MPSAHFDTFVIRSFYILSRVSLVEDRTGIVLDVSGNTIFIKEKILIATSFCIKETYSNREINSHLQSEQVRIS